MAHNRSLDEVLTAVVRGLAECRNIVLARIWLLEKGDLCQDCALREECPDQTTCLHLVASAGNSKRRRKRDYRRLDGRFRRFPIGVRKIGEVAQTGQPKRIRGIGGRESWLAEPAWAREEGVESFAAQPLVFRGVVLGVLAIFDREELSASDFEWLEVLADHAAVSIANAQAFEEIEYLKQRLEEENDYLRDEVRSVAGPKALVGDSVGMQRVYGQIELVAPTDAAVLVTGESGTGKELIARAIHDQSDRAKRSLIKVNCGAIPENLFESEFFGHVKGAFTGALKSKAGRFELADGGTLFLDEIGEVPLPLQAKLLRVLQEGELERVGGEETIHVDVRIIAATNRDLRGEVKAGRFREDLFYRLVVFPIEVPPLRERTDDIGPLVKHFAAQAAARMNREVPRVTQGLVRELERYEWPGNVRELQNAIERAVILARKGPLRLDLPSQSRRRHEGVVSPLQAEGNVVLTEPEMREREAANIAAALRESRGKVFGEGGAAERMLMKPTTLASRIKVLGIDRSVFTK